MAHKINKEVDESMTNQTLTFPTIAAVGHIDAYVQAAKQFPVLTAEEEYRLATRFHEQEDVEAIEKMEQIRSVSGSISTDVIIKSQDSSESVIMAHSMMGQINLLKLVDGRLPQAADVTAAQSTPLCS